MYYAARWPCNKFRRSLALRALIRNVRVCNFPFLQCSVEYNILDFAMLSKFEMAVM